MGKYSVGAKVLDADGDEAEVIGKPSKGMRRIRLLSGWLGVEYDAPKSSLTATNDNDAPSISPEVSVSAYSSAEGGEDKPWVPKVGDRVRMRGDSEWHCPDTSTVGTVVEPDEGTISPFAAVFDGDTFKWHLELADLEPVVAPATTWTPVAGKFGKTRDGRKVGPMRRSNSDSPGFYWVAPETESGFGSAWHKDGIFHPKDSPYWTERSYAFDLVAEWVEPAALTAWQAATEESEISVAEAQPRFKAGDKVRCVNSSWGSAYRAGEIYEVRVASIGRISTVLDSVGSTTNGWGDHNFELVVEPVAVAEATATLLTIVEGATYRSRHGEVWTDPKPIAEGDAVWSIMDSYGARYKFLEDDLGLHAAVVLLFQVDRAGLEQGVHFRHQRIVTAAALVLGVFGVDFVLKSKLCHNGS